MKDLAFRLFILGSFFLFGLLISAEVSFASRVDLEVDHIQVQPPRLDTTSKIVVSPSIKNKGSEEAEQFNISLTLKQGKRVLKTIPNIPVIGKLPRNGSGISVPVEIGKLPEGEYEAIIVADSDNRISETNEKNNMQTKEFRVWEPSYRTVTYGYN